MSPSLMLAAKVVAIRLQDKFQITDPKGVEIVSLADLTQAVADALWATITDDEREREL